jgi:hypothetical protein
MNCGSNLTPPEGIAVTSTAAEHRGIEMYPGDHICALYDGGQARDELVLSFLRSGLDSGDKCICILDEGDHQVVLSQFYDHRSEHSAGLAAQLDLLTPWETYLKSSQFSSVEMLNFWSDSINSAVGHGQFDAARVTGDTTWLLSAAEGTIREFLSYESELNRFVDEHPVSILCLYDLAAFGGGILVDLMKTHPKLLLGGMLLENPHALSPDEFLAER